MNCSLPDSSVHGIFQARILDWVAVPFSKGSSQSRDRTQVSHIAGGFFTIWATRESLNLGIQLNWGPLVSSPFCSVCPVCHLCSPMGFPGGSDSKGSACYAGYPGLIPGLGRSPGKGNGYPFQYSGLENSMDRGAWRATVYGVTKSQTQLRN